MLNYLYIETYHQNVVCTILYIKFGTLVNDINIPNI